MSQKQQNDYNGATFVRQSIINEQSDI